jgi:hypothetical protein
MLSGPLDKDLGSQSLLLLEVDDFRPSKASLVFLVDF